MKKLQETHTCPDCGTKAKVRWSEEYNDMIIECTNRNCDTGFIQIFIGHACGIVGLFPRCKA